MHNTSWKAIPVHSCSYLQSDPFKSNLLLQSYAGLFNYILWRSALTEDTPLPTELGEGSQGRVTEEERQGLVVKGEEEEEELMDDQFGLIGTGKSGTRSSVVVGRDTGWIGIRFGNTYTNTCRQGSALATSLTCSPYRCSSSLSSVLP